MDKRAMLNYERSCCRPEELPGPNQKLWTRQVQGYVGKRGWLDGDSRSGFAAVTGTKRSEVLKRDGWLGDRNGSIPAKEMRIRSAGAG
jgi:hypothetical protein